MRKIKHLFCLFGLLTSQLLWADYQSMAAYEGAPTESPLTFGLDINYGAVYYKQYEFGPNARTSAQGHAAHVDFEWLPLQTFGKLGIGLGTAAVFGFRGNTGSGEYADLTMYPLRTFISYRLEFTRRQAIVPFAKVGTSFIWARQSGQTQTKTYRGLDYGFGLEICLSNLDKEASKNLDRNIGINSTYLTVQYSKSSPLGNSNTANLSHEEYLAGLRFEM